MYSTHQFHFYHPDYCILINAGQMDYFLISKTVVYFSNFDHNLLV